MVGVVLLIPTAYAGVIGAPYAPTRHAVIKKAFDAIRLGAGDTLVDLGAGDGYIVLEAARCGADAVGYELSPIMWAISHLRGASVKFGNFYKQNISDATVVFAFLLPKNMPRLKAYLATQSLPRGKYLLSYSFPLPDVTPINTVTVPERGTIYIYDLKTLTKP